MRHAALAALAAFAALSLLPAVARAQSSPPAQDCGVWEAVEPGDTLAGIARRCGVSEAQLADTNTDLDLSRLQMGTIVTIRPFEATPQPEEVSGSSGNAALDAYRRKVRGRWRGAGESCSAVAGSWTFDNLTVRGNATVFDIVATAGTADHILLETVRRGDGARIVLTLRAQGDSVAVNAPGLAADLLRCPD